MVRARIVLSVFALALLAAGIASAETAIYAVVLGNPKYLVGSSTLNSGLFRSMDQGITWEHLGPRNLKAYAVDAVDSSRGRILYLAAGNGVHRSIDGGATWRIITDWRITEVMDVKVDQRDPRRIYAGTAFGLWRSLDGGETWENPDGMLKTRYVYRIDKIDQSNELSVSSDDGILLSYDSSNSWSYQLETKSPRGLYTIGTYGKLLAGDQGPIWYPSTEYTSSVTRPGVIYPRMSTFAAAYRNDTIFAAGNNGIWIYVISSRSSAWKDFTQGMPRMVHAIAVTGSTVIAGTFGNGVYRWQKNAWVAAGLEGAQVWSITVKEW